MSLESYWRAFSSNSGENMLENRGLPILEVNAGFPKAIGHILKIKHFYAARGRPACLILPESSKLQLAASNAQFVPHAGFVVLECQPEFEPNWMNGPIIEQVGWDAARSLAQNWCDSVGATGWEVSVASEIARVMPVHPKILAYQALENSHVVGMGFVFEGDLHWLAGDAQTKRVIVRRAAFDAGGPIQFSVGPEETPSFQASIELQRHVIWTETSSR
jgi:hypothetical protein